ncbi:STAP2 protein, partial [Alectura lathami]|nr:STAP2 protein [Alectura lathami]
QDYRRLWAGLRGLSLAFYGAPRDQQPLELLDLGELLAVRAEGGALVLQLRDQKVMLKVRGTEGAGGTGACRALQGKVPADLVLLPGHIFQLLEALREEQERWPSPRPAQPPVPLMPSCFVNVSRVEAEQLLERNAGSGSMVLRPGGHSHGFSVTTRQEKNGTALFKHYRVVSSGQGYLIDVDEPHHCSSLDEVVQYFVEKSKGSLKPLHLEYSLKLEFVETDSESGETTLGGSQPRPTPQPRR